MAAQTFALLAPNAGQQFYTGSVIYTADANAVVTLVPLSAVSDLVKAGCIPLGPSTNDAVGWNAYAGPPQLLAAAGASVGTAGKITANTVYLSASASTEGVVLKLVATGARTFIRANQTVGAKIYSPPGTTLDANGSATGTLLVAGKGSLFEQTSATHFVTLIKGA